MYILYICTYLPRFTRTNNSTDLIFIQVSILPTKLEVLQVFFTTSKRTLKPGAFEADAEAVAALLFVRQRGGATDFRNEEQKVAGGETRRKV